MADKKREKCFVIMPISDPDGYENGHFKHVYDDLICPACETAGYKPVRADDVLQTNLIHLDVLKNIIETPMAICDLSTRNPNVLFELGLRQAFDKPVVLIQETETPQIFDIAPLRYTEYRKERVYHHVLEDQKSIGDALMATAEAHKKGDGVNSIVKLLSLTSPAALKELRGEESSPLMQVLMSEMGALRREFRVAFQEIEHNRHYRRAPVISKVSRLKNQLHFVEVLMNADAINYDELKNAGLILDNLIRDVELREWAAEPPGAQAEGRQVLVKALSIRDKVTNFLTGSPDD